MTPDIQFEVIVTSNIITILFKMQRKSNVCFIPLGTLNLLMKRLLGSNLSQLAQTIRALGQTIRRSGQSVRTLGHTVSYLLVF